MWQPKLEPSTSSCSNSLMHLANRRTTTPDSPCDSVSMHGGTDLRQLPDICDAPAFRHEAVRYRPNKGRHGKSLPGMG